MNQARILWKRFTIEIDSRLEAVPLLGQVVHSLCAAAGFAPDEANRIEVCVVEAINNSIEHAYQGAPARTVEIELELLPNQLIIDVWDSGTSADADKMHADHRHALDIPSDAVCDIAEHGRGLAVIQEVMDSFEYTPGRERNRLRMTKWRDLVALCPITAASTGEVRTRDGLLHVPEIRKRGYVSVTTRNTSALLEVMKVMFKPHPWHGISMGNHAPETVTCYIEIVPADSVKYEIEKTTGYLKVDRPQRFSSFSPCLYGLIPRTYCGARVAAIAAEKAKRFGIQGDHDPLDICVITEKTITHGDILLEAIPIGGLRMLDGEEADDKIIAVLKGDAVFGAIHDISDCPEGLVQRIVHYFLTYKQMPDAAGACEVTQVYGRREAHHVIMESKADYDERFADLSSLIEQVLPDAYQSSDAFGRQG
jgi:inorganic pyrophosphatase